MTALVPPWNSRELRTGHPVMTIGSTAAPSVALAAIAEGLAEAGFRIRYDGTEAFTARYLGWRRPGGLVVLKLEADVTDEGVRIRVAAGRGGKDGTRHASDGLSRAVVGLRTQGFEVTTTTWSRA